MLTQPAKSSESTVSLRDHDQRFFLRVKKSNICFLLSVNERRNPFLRTYSPFSQSVTPKPNTRSFVSFAAYPITAWIWLLKKSSN